MCAVRQRLQSTAQEESHVTSELCSLFDSVCTIRTSLYWFIAGLHNVVHRTTARSSLRVPRICKSSHVVSPKLAGITRSMQVNLTLMRKPASLLRLEVSETVSKTSKSYKPTWTNLACVEEDLAQKCALLFIQYVSLCTRVAYEDTITIHSFFVGASPNVNTAHVCQSR